MFLSMKPIRRTMAEHTTGAEQEKWVAAVKEELFHREQVDRYFASITKEPRFYQCTTGVKNFHCYKKAIDQFTSMMGMSDVFANMCNENGHAF